MKVSIIVGELRKVALLLLVVLVAGGLIVLAEKASEAAFGQDILETGVELFLATLAGVVCTSPIWGLGIITKKGLLVAAALPFMAVFWGCQLAASLQMAPIKAEFHRVARQGPIKIDWAVGEESNERYNAADFGGALDALVKERDSRLSSLGFCHLGAWTYKNGAANTAIWCIARPGVLWNGFWRYTLALAGLGFYCWFMWYATELQYARYR